MPPNRTSNDINFCSTDSIPYSTNLGPNNLPRWPPAAFEPLRVEDFFSTP